MIAPELLERIIPRRPVVEDPDAWQCDLENGLPVNRTMCPRCQSDPKRRDECKVCHGTRVCPVCRNGRVVSVAGDALVYRVCPGCCEPMKDERTGQFLFSDTGLPRWYWHGHKQTQAIRRYLVTHYPEQLERAA